MATTTEATLIDRLMQSPLGQQIQREDAEQHAAARRGHIEALAALEKESLAKMPPLLAAREAADQERRAALEAVQVATERYYLAHGAVQTLSFRVDAERERHRRVLEQSAPAAIDSFLSDLEAELARLRKLSPDVFRTRSKLLRSLGEAVVVSNRDKIASRIKACVVARDAARELRHQAIEGDELTKRLGELWRSLPGIALEVTK